MVQIVNSYCTNLWFKYPWVYVVIPFQFGLDRSATDCLKVVRMHMIQIAQKANSHQTKSYSLELRIFRYQYFF